MYADDCQLYITCDSPDLNDSISKMESLISDIRVWYSRNMLKLNDSKTQMLVIRSKFRQNFHFRDISIGESIIPPSPTIRNIGVTWWRHQMETFSALLAICAGNSPVSGEFPTQRPVTRSFDIIFDLRLNKQLSKQS